MLDAQAARRGRLGILATLVVASLVMAVTAEAPAGARAKASQADEYTLTLLHNNDGESQLINAGEGLADFGGIARFVTKARMEQRAGERGGDRGVLTVSSGDNFLAGPEFNASLEKGRPYYDAIGMERVRYDAIAIGNHDFDFGPDVLAEFIGSFKDVPFLSSNLDVSAEPLLQRLKDKGRIADSVVVSRDGEDFGIIGATTPVLPFISSPRNVVVNPDVAGEVQDEVDALEAAGVDKIILISHLQSISEDLDLATDLSGVDIMVAGGGDELLANPGDLLIPGDEGLIFGPYPLIAMDADGGEVPVVTTKGSYTYLGKLVAEFDADGNVTEIDDGSGPLRIAGGAQPDAVEPDNFVMIKVVEPVIEALEALAQNVIGTSEVDLDGRRSEVRTRETNEGNLATDALLWQAQQLAGQFGVPSPNIAIQNAGGIRNDSIIPAGPITELHTFDMLPFANFVSVVPDVSRDTFKALLENAVSRVEFTDGRFAQIAGFSFTYNAAAAAGSRVVSASFADGTPLIQNGAVVAGPALHIATIDFLARGGDQYPYGGADFTTLGVTYQQSLANYIVDGLGGLITAADYPVGGEGRITRLN
jgi:5'-nucleotidase